jgi:polar amino acid transport system substrate-binding protein
MKKTLAVIMAATMALALAGCGSSSSTSTTTAAASEAATEAATAAASEAETTAAGETTTETAETTAEAASDMAYVKDKGTLVVGITEFEPMDYKDADGNWIGFDADMAKAFAESLGVTAEFVEIDWDNKILELDGKTIDCVWNGMTLTDEVKSAMSTSNAYCNNAQVVIVKADVADQYQDTDSLKDLSFAVEAGSAGEAEVSALGLNYTPVKAQSDALMEVAAGTSDAAVIDALMASAMVGEGTGYENLTYTIGLNSEEYGVGFRKGSDLTEALNDFFKTSYNDGSMLSCAEEYGVQAAVVEQ